MAKQKQSKYHYIRPEEEKRSFAEFIKTFPRKYGKRIRVIAWSVLSALIIIALAGTVIASGNHSWIDMSLTGGESVTIEYDQPYVEKGAKARFHSSALKFLDRDIAVKTDGEVENGRIGSYNVTYTSDLGELHAEKSRTVNIVDTKAPEIKLVSDSNHYTLPGHEYDEEGFTAIDEYDGDITGKVVRTEENGFVTYSVSDSSGNIATAVRTILYDDRTAPVLDIGESRVMLLKGDVWKDSYSAVDDLDGDVTENVSVSGSVDTSTPGKYEISYSVEDAHGNRAEAVKTVVVLKDADDVHGMAEAGEKVVFLTFDDGPGPYTETLLDILAEYGVKATFFVTYQRPEYEDMIGRAYKEGHGIGVHTLTHDFYQIYQSGTTFWNDIEAMNDIVQEQTGKRTDFFRFAGGSSNTISMQSNNRDGIMGRLIRQAGNKGYDFFDWNVDSNDAGGAATAEEVYENVISGVEKLDISVVLMHDIHDYTVEAVPDILKYGIEHGWHFMVLKKGIYTCHHQVNN